MGTSLDKEEELKFIEELRELKEVKKLTFQEIADKTVENGEPVSIAAVKKVFSNHARHNHDYKHTLLPIFNALVDNEDKESPVNQLYITRLEIKNETIKRQEEQIKALQEEFQERLKKKEEKHKDREQFYMNMIEHMMSQISFKDEQIKHHNETLDRKDKELKELYELLLSKKS